MGGHLSPRRIWYSRYNVQHQQGFGVYRIKKATRHVAKERNADLRDFYLV